MITESIAILAIMLCLIVVFIRAQQSDYALGVTPLLLVPFIHLFAVAVFYLGRVPFFGFAPQVAVALQISPQLPYLVRLSFPSVSTSKKAEIGNCILH